MRLYTWGRPTRSGLFITLSLTLAGPALPVRGAAQPSGLPLAPTSPGDATRWLSGSPIGLRLDLADGSPVVVAMKSGDAAERSGLRQGDRVLRINDQAAGSTETAAEQIQTSWKAGKSAVDLVISRSGQNFYIALRLRQ